MLPSGLLIRVVFSAIAALLSTTWYYWSEWLMNIGNAKTLGELPGESKATSDWLGETLAAFAKADYIPLSDLRHDQSY